MTVQFDSNSNPYFDHENVRLTLIVNRDPEKDWQGDGAIYFRIQAYQQNGRLLPGAEFPLSTPEAAVGFLVKTSELISRCFFPQG